MRFDIMTLFPDMVDTVLGTSIIGRAVQNGAIEIYTHNIRKYSKDKHRRVDDTPYGGGMGMLMAAPPIYDCWKAVKDSVGADKKTLTVYMSPCGKVLDQKKARDLTHYDALIILCGHYEGIDQRIIDEIVDEELSIGDYVLTGGELPACVLVDCVSRMIDGVLSDSECYENESIASGMLEYPQYTRPVEFHGMKVPEVLQRGNHSDINKWRYKAALERTAKNRPDLM
ncbi:MAG: tRNA (guanosine(37)-N1)-methyltransferase TrmD [Ruminococcaceae bacterium]|nr:tRNA (guanosine(37)-N1)-methyltransferase TrmD [Oscillospiraceae bacterium]